MSSKIPVIKTAASAAAAMQSCGREEAPECGDTRALHSLALGVRDVAAVDVARLETGHTHHAPAADDAPQVTISDIINSSAQK